MPSSRPNTIPTVIHLVRQLRPKSILDVGVGFGKWGHLFREYTDINEAEQDPTRYRRKNWRVRIDGIEGHAAYLTPMHRYLYDRIHIGDAGELMKKLPRYDLVFMGDIIEHFEKRAGLRLLRDALKKAGKAVIVTTPKYETGQADLCANELERHRSLWSAKDFERFKRATVKTIDRATLLAVLHKDGAPQLHCTPPLSAKTAESRRLRLAIQDIERHLPLAEWFVLVDEEQIRSRLPHKHALPFLQRAGMYWGPPPDDATAIQELEQLRKTGASRMVFVWSCFWWLEHYSALNRHLRERFPVSLSNERVLIFDLRP
ncbi:MAG TPA: class I SAM-dependent methyltransferase [Candidatus Angelobacter sp.]|nr:class I SAM-dependent methyltransferase [Candidatus Angelobacter sp.]